MLAEFWIPLPPLEEQERLVNKIEELFEKSDSIKPLEIEFQDDDGVVTFLSLNIFEKYLTGKLISEDGNNVIRPVRII